MRKVGIITFHHAKHSYGAFLQAFATIRAVENLGYDAEIINYENVYEQSEIKTRHAGFKERAVRFFNWALRFFVFGGMADPCRSKKELDQFYRSVSKRYSSLKELNETSYDILICGSDQIWNPDVCNGIDPAFYLNFGESDAVRISYASSMGSYHFTQDELLRIKSYLSRFAAVSVREKYAADILMTVCKSSIKVVCDPTLLLTGEQWRKEFQQEFSVFKKEEPYILTYFVGGNITEYWERISEIVERLKMPVYNVQSHSKRYNHVKKSVYNIMPGELLAYIENADIVLTDSFHGTAFSINLCKDFVSVLNRKNPVRVINLLECLDLKDRLDDNKQMKLTGGIDYDKVNIKLQDFRKDSYEWLENAMKSGLEANNGTY